MKSYLIQSVFRSRAGVSLSVLCEEETARELLISPELWEGAVPAEGSLLTEEAFATLDRRAALSRARARARDILSYSGQSRRSLIQKLCHHGVDEDIAEETADWAKEQNLMNEQEEAALLADTYHRRKYWGQKRIAQELFQKGYPEEAIREAIRSIPPEEYLRALTTLIEKKFGEIPDDPSEKQKMVFSLLRLGYTGAEIKEAFLLFEEEN